MASLPTTSPGDIYKLSPNQILRDSGLNESVELVWESEAFALADINDWMMRETAKFQEETGHTGLLEYYDPEEGIVPTSYNNQELLLFKDCITLRVLVKVYSKATAHQPDNDNWLRLLKLVKADAEQWTFNLTQSMEHIEAVIWPDRFQKALGETYTGTQTALPSNSNTRESSVYKDNSGDGVF